MIINPYLVQPSVPAFTGLLDTYSGAAAGYSAARRLSSTYTGSLIRVRRSSDNTEQDIGYDGSNVLDESALTTFVGAGNGFITKLYDQSGNTIDIAQSTALSQPKIVNSGTVLKVNTKPYFQTDGSSFLFNNTLSLNGTTNSIFVTLKVDTTKGVIAMMSGGSDTNQHFPSRAGDGTNRYYDTTATTTASALPNGLNLVNIHETSSGNTVYENNVLLMSNEPHNTTDSTGLYLLARTAGNNLPSGWGMSEVIIYSGTSKLSDNSGISTNINTFYSIY
jgi:hypothetical protein